ncbi:MAG: phosphate ABC transporter permease subunit PstC [Hyphomonadaceae bacterium]|jgi:phosphate transport system permease protein|nr:phosphate ABC transporter permease subunit PstC [Hyphomonadaceae bacterium]
MAQWGSFPFGWVALALCSLIALFAWRDAHGRAIALAGGNERLHSRPVFHAAYAMLATLLPVLAAGVVWLIAAPMVVNSFVAGALPEAIQSGSQDARALFLIDAHRLAGGGMASQTSPALEDAARAINTAQAVSGVIGMMLLIVAGLAGWLASRKAVSTGFRARNAVETAMQWGMGLAAGIAILTTAGIVLSLLFETVKFFSSYSPFSFLTGLQWSPQVAIRSDQVGQSGAFGAVPLFLGTVLIMLIAMVVAVPVGLGSAVYLSEYASPKARAALKPVLELLAGIPTVVYGFFALLTVAPVVRDLGMAVGLDVASQSALAAGLVMGIMIIPFISSLSDDVINAVPQSLRDGSMAMGATRSETISKVILPAALPGIVGSVLLGVSRALGETMIVTMAAGQNANLTANPLDMVTTVTVQIVTLLTGDQEYDSPKTQAAFALGFVLFLVTLVLNVIALRVVQKYREKYD